MEAQYEVLIHETYGEDLTFIVGIPVHRPMFYPTLHDTMSALGPVLANHYERPVQTQVVKAVDFKNYRVVEFTVDATRAVIAIIKEVKNPLHYRS